MIDKRENKRDKKRRNRKHDKQKSRDFEFDSDFELDKEIEEALSVVDMHGKPWKIVGTFTSFEEADKKRKRLLRKKGNPFNVKVKLMRKNNNFVVKTRHKFLTEKVK